MTLIKAATAEGTTLKIRLHNDIVLTFEDCWLRDHCRCSQCYHSSTNQRALHILDIPEATIQSVNTQNSNVEIKWSDGHESTYSVNFLERYGYENWKQPKYSPVLWCGDSVAAKIARLPVKEFIQNVVGEKKIFKSLLDYGIAVIEQVEPTMEATEAVCEALGGVQHTMFGGMWKVSTIPEYADTAYMNIPLKQHTDNTYFTEPAGNSFTGGFLWLGFVKYGKAEVMLNRRGALNFSRLGLQIFHCTEHINGSGGENVFIDGFYAAMKLKEEHPEDFEFLTKFEIDAEFIGDGHFHKYSAPVIQLDKFNNIKHIRFNSYDRSPMTFKNSRECRTYYRALKNLARYFEDPNNQWQIKLTPGSLLAFDNFRVLHGRTAFTGKRILCGSYVSRSDWLDKARFLGLL